MALGAWFTLTLASTLGASAADVEDCFPLEPMKSWEVQREFGGHELHGYSFNTNAQWSERLHDNGITEFRNASGDVFLGQWKLADALLCFSYGTMTGWACKTVHRAAAGCELFRYALVDDRGKVASAIFETRRLDDGGGDRDTPAAGSAAQDGAVGTRAEVHERDEPEDDAGGTGTGFVVDRSGVILTNAHVVLDCRSITIDDGRAASVVAADKELDLAVVRTTGIGWPAAARFAAGSARLNSDVTVVGFPLHGLLGGINVTRGAVSAGKGLGGRISEFQISAAVQPGNSGGPVLDASGAVVGVVRSKLDAMKVAGIIGDIPQNINFAVRGEVAKLFMVANGIRFQLATDAGPMAPADLAEAAKDFTVLINCLR